MSRRRYQITLYLLLLINLFSLFNKLSLYLHSVQTLHDPSLQPAHVWKPWLNKKLTYSALIWWREVTHPSTCTAPLLVIHEYRQVSTAGNFGVILQGWTVGACLHCKNLPHRTAYTNFYRGQRVPVGLGRSLA